MKIATLVQYPDHSSGYACPNCKQQGTLFDRFTVKAGFRGFRRVSFFQCRLCNKKCKPMKSRQLKHALAV
jgi:hypothetical protein